MTRSRGGRGPWRAAWGARTRRWHQQARRLREAAERRFPAITELTARLIAVNVLEGGTRLAAQIFLTAVPLLFVVAAFAPQGLRDQLLTSARDVFGLTGASEQQLQDIYRTSSEEARQTTGVIGTIVALLSATSASRAMTRICERAWRLPKAGVRVVIWRWFAWLASWLAVLVLQGPLRDGFGAGRLLGLPLTFLSEVVLWWWTQALLLGGRVPRRHLLPGAVLTALALTALAVTASVYMPTALNRSLATYGPLGSIFTLQSWLIAVCVVIAFTLTAGAVLATTDQPLGRPPRRRPRP